MAGPRRLRLRELVLPPLTFPEAATGRFGHRPLGIPAGVQSVLDCVPRDTTRRGPLRNGPFEPVDSDAVVVVPAIVVLLYCCSPPTIGGYVVAVGYREPVDCVFRRRPWTHVGEERREGLHPRRVHLNTPSTIVGVRVVVRVGAPGEDRPPHDVLRRRRPAGRVTVMGVGLPDLLRLPAATATGPTRPPQVAAVHLPLDAADAPAEPLSVGSADVADDVPVADVRLGEIDPRGAHVVSRLQSDRLHV